MGRAPVDLQQAEKGLSAAAVAERILDVLLELQSRKDRVAMLPEAFTPASPGHCQASRSQRINGQAFLVTQQLKLIGFMFLLA